MIPYILSKRISKIIGYLVILIVVAYAISSAIVSISFYNRCNNWVVGSSGQLLAADAVEIGKAKSVASKYLLALAASDYQTCNSLTLPEVMQNIRGFSDNQQKLRIAYLRQRSNNYLSEESDSVEFDVITAIRFDMIRSLINQSLGEHVNRNKIFECRWPERVMVMGLRSTNNPWIILGKLDDNWMLLTISSAAP